jgi:hypothetical protein
MPQRYRYRQRAITLEFRRAIKDIWISETPLPDIAEDKPVKVYDSNVWTVDANPTSGWASKAPEAWHDTKETTSDKASMKKISNSTYRAKNEKPKTARLLKEYTECKYPMF